MPVSRRSSSARRGKGVGRKSEAEGVSVDSVGTVEPVVDSEAASLGDKETLGNMTDGEEDVGRGDGDSSVEGMNDLVVGHNGNIEETMDVVILPGPISKVARLGPIIEENKRRVSPRKVEICVGKGVMKQPDPLVEASKYDKEWGRKCHNFNLYRVSKDGASVEIQLTMYTKFLGLVKNRVDLLNLFRVWKNTASFCADNGTLKVEVDNCLQANDVDEFVVCSLIPSQVLLTLKKPQLVSILDSLGLMSKFFCKFAKCFEVSSFPDELREVIRMSSEGNLLPNVRRLDYTYTIMFICRYMGWMTLRGKKNETLAKHPFLGKALYFLEWFLFKAASGTDVSSEDEQNEVVENGSVVGGGGIDKKAALRLKKQIVNFFDEVLQSTNDVVPKGFQSVLMSESDAKEFKTWCQFVQFKKMNKVVEGDDADDFVVKRRKQE
jgi:hypothetical protein